MQPWLLIREATTLWPGHQALWAVPPVLEGVLYCPLLCGGLHGLRVSQGSPFGTSQIQSLGMRSSAIALLCGDWGVCHSKPWLRASRALFIHLQLIPSEGKMPSS